MHARHIAPILLVLTHAWLMPTSTAASSSEAQVLDQGRGTASHSLLRLQRPILPAPARADVIGPRRDNGSSPEAVQYFVHNEDVSIVGSQCVGFDCTGAETFGFDTIRMKENNTRIKFEDTSTTGSFPYKDWQLTANDSNDGGRNMFSIDNVTDGRSPFTIMDSARNFALYLAGNNAGFGTSAPLTSLHTLSGDTPTLRLDQDGSMGYASQVWDVGGNEAGYFVRDVTSGGTLTLRVLPASGAHALVVAPAGVGLGTNAPAARLHLSHASPTMQVTNTTTTTNTLSLDPSGNLTLSGLLFESSSREMKENLTPVDSEALLDRVAGLPLYEWNYKADDPSTTHLGPVAEEFAAAFGLGRDERHIAALDASGVALGAIQALARRNQAKDARIAALEAQLQGQAAALEKLSAELKALLERVETR